MTNDSTPALHTNPPSYALRRLVVFLVGLGALYLFAWVPWREHEAIFLLFVGAGMIQLSATYAQESNPAVIPPAFMGVFVRLFVAVVAVALLIAELAIGFEFKSWWEAILLPLPTFAVSGIWYKSHNPAPPFFSGLIALILALLVALLV